MNGNDKQPAQPSAAQPSAAQEAAIEQIAQQWDGCKYDSVGETIDIGAAIRAAGKRIAPVAAAPEGFVMASLASEARELQRKNYGCGMGLHLDMIDWAKKFDAILAARPQGVE